MHMIEADSTTHQAKDSVGAANRQFGDVEAIRVSHAQQVAILVGEVVLAAAERLRAYVLQGLHSTAAQ